MPAAAPIASDSFRFAPLAVTLAMTQMASWGTSFWLPAVLVGPLVSDLGLTPETVFGGVSVMMLTSALVAPRLGRIVDTRGARWPMVAGSLLFAGALAAMAHAGSAVTYLAAWILIGLGTPLVLTQAAAAAMAQIVGSRARQAIGLIVLLGGMSSTVFWPLTVWLIGLFGWRGACLVFAAMHLLLCAPVHALALRSARVGSGGLAAGAAPEGPDLSPRERRTAFVLMALAFSFTGFVSWGLPLQVVEIVKAGGHSAAFAVFVGTLMGPAQVAARFAEMVFGSRFGILAVGVLASALMPVALAPPIFAPTSAAIAAGFVIGYGLSAGAMTVVRTVAPLALFGSSTFATMTGWLALPQSVVFAASPMLFAWTMTRFGPAGTLAMALAASLGALVTMVMLERRFRRKAVA